MDATDELRQPADDVPPLVRLVQRLESTPALDRLSPLLSPLADGLLSSPQRRSLLLGTAMGHAAHPFLTDLPIGAWTSTTLLDLVGGERSRTAARRLLGIGLVAAGPTALTGLAEWGTTDGGDRRVGAAHAGANTVALACYASSYVARSRDRHAVGVVLALSGAMATAVGGFLGGHLALARNVATRDPAFDDSRASPTQ